MDDDSSIFDDGRSQDSGLSDHSNNYWDYGEHLCDEASDWKEESPAEKKRIVEDFYSVVNKIRDCQMNNNNDNDLPLTVQNAFDNSIGPIVKRIEISIQKQGSWWDGMTYYAIGKAIDNDDKKWKLKSRWEKNRIMENFYSIIDKRTNGKKKKVRNTIDESIGPLVGEINYEMETFIQEQIIDRGFFQIDGMLQGVVLTVQQLENIYRLYPDIVNGNMYSERPVLAAARGDNGSLKENKRRAIQSIPLIPKLVDLHKEFADNGLGEDRYGLLCVDSWYNDEMNTLQVLADCSPIKARDGIDGDDDNSDDDSDNNSNDDDSDEDDDEDDGGRDYNGELDQVKLDVMKKLRRRKVFLKSDVKKYDLVHNVCKNVDDGYFSDARFNYLVNFDPTSLGSKSNSSDFNGRVPLHLCVKNRSKFRLLFNAGMERFPEHFGFLFHQDSSNETETPYRLAYKLWSKRSITKLLWKKLKIARKKAGFQERINAVDGDVEEEEETAVALRWNNRLSTESMIVEAASNPNVSLDCLLLLLLRDPSVVAPIAAVLSAATEATAVSACSSRGRRGRKRKQTKIKADGTSASAAMKKAKKKETITKPPSLSKSKKPPMASSKMKKPSTAKVAKKKKARKVVVAAVAVAKKKPTKPKPIFVWITQGKADHLAEIIDSDVLSVLASQSLSSKKKPLTSLFAKDSEMNVKWQSTNGIETVDVSAARLLFDEESFLSQRGGRRSSRR